MILTPRFSLFSMCVLLAASAGCFAERAFPANADIPCTQPSDCPSEFACRVAVGRCLPQNGLDSGLPSALEVSVDAAVLTYGDSAHVSFGTEPLLAPPVVVAGDLGAVVATQSPFDAHVVTVTVPIDYEGEDGVRTVVADVVDASGNAAHLELLDVTLDFHGPTTVFVDVSAAETIDVEGVIGVDFALSEPVGTLLEVHLTERRLDGLDVILPMELVPDVGPQEPEYNGYYELLGNENAGIYDLTLNVNDVVGNTAVIFLAKVTLP